MTRRILGVDPGLNITGYGVLQSDGHDVRLLEAGVVTSHARTLAGRINDIYTGIQDVLAQYKPEALALEELYSHYKRPMTAVLMGHVRGAICLAAAQSGIPVVPYAATKIKRTLTGNGRATKEQMQRAITVTFHLKSVPNPPDVADAAAIALCHYYHSR
ncbi:MAG: crossover junction endodeoxyribonuclease RuvC [Planctomycetia bacterium]|nr:crossover junction endodeoxyribonuclease RuvC [Planctomycetia bacterium]